MNTKEKRITLGICTICGERQLINKNECSVCRDKRNLKNREKWKSGVTRSKFHAKRKERISNGVCTKCGKLKALQPHRECEKCLKKYYESYKKWKDIAYQGYGGYCCSCCGETIIEFLTLDHINNDGAHHRRKLCDEKGNISATRGKSLYRWIVRNNFPPIFQVLCCNCNFGKQINGGVCPHEKSNAKILVKTLLSSLGGVPWAAKKR